MEKRVEEKMMEAKYIGNGSIELTFEVTVVG